MYTFFVQICFHGTLLAAYSLTRKALSALYMCGGVLANWTFPSELTPGVFIKFSPEKKKESAGNVTETFQRLTRRRTDCIFFEIRMIPHGELDLTISLDRITIILIIMRYSIHMCAITVIAT